MKKAIERNATEISLKEAIENMLHAYKLNGKIYEIKLVDKWGSIVGTPIANHTKEVFLKGKKLCLKLDNAALRQELSYSKELLIKRVNDELGANIVEEVSFL